MKLEDINSRIQVINCKLINPDNYPYVITGDDVQGVIAARQDGTTVSLEDFVNTILALAKYNESEIIVAAEDFERIYKSTGFRERINFETRIDWKLFSNLCAQSAMISFYVFDAAMNWCAWFSDNYFVVTFRNNLSHLIGSEYSFENAIQKFKEADQDFICFVRNLYRMT